MRGRAESAAGIRSAGPTAVDRGLRHAPSIAIHETGLPAIVCDGSLRGCAEVELLIIGILILLNGFFSMSEMAVATSRQSRLQARIAEGHTGARLVLQLSRNPGTFLATVQVGITTIGILSGAFGEQAIVRGLAGWLMGVPMLAAYSETIATVVMVLALTYVSVVFGEIVPKRLALLNPEKIAGAVAGPMLLLERIAQPIVWVFSLSSNALLRLIDSGTHRDEPPVTEQEIRLMLRQGTAAGVFEHSEEAMLGNVFRLGDVPVSAIMTPRRDIVFLPTPDPAPLRELLRSSAGSELLVCNDGLDDILGVLDLRALAHALIDGEVRDLRPLVAPALFVPESASPARLLARLREQHRHGALVVDEYGHVIGMVTLTDLVDAITAGMDNSPDAVGSEAVQRSDGSWLLDGLLATDRVARLLDLPEIADRSAYQRLGGFVLDGLGRLPAVGDIVTFHGWTFEVVDMDGNRVDRVLASRRSS